MNIENERNLSSRSDGISIVRIGVQVYFFLSFSVKRFREIPPKKRKMGIVRDARSIVIGNGRLE